MEKNLQRYLISRPELINFIRFNPEWYRYLSREPWRVYEIDKEAKQFYGKTMPQKIERFNQNVAMVGMLLQFAEMMKD